jgi:hypothetical protein
MVTTIASPRPSLDSAPACGPCTGPLIAWQRREPGSCREKLGLDRRQRPGLCEVSDTVRPHGSNVHAAPACWQGFPLIADRFDRFRFGQLCEVGGLLPIAGDACSQRGDRTQGASHLEALVAHRAVPVFPRCPGAHLRKGGSISSRSQQRSTICQSQICDSVLRGHHPGASKRELPGLFCYSISGTSGGQHGRSTFQRDSPGSPLWLMLPMIWQPSLTIRCGPSDPV